MKFAKSICSPFEVFVWCRGRSFFICAVHGRDPAIDLKKVVGLYMGQLVHFARVVPTVLEIVLLEGAMDVASEL